MSSPPNCRNDASGKRDSSACWPRRMKNGTSSVKRYSRTSAQRCERRSSGGGDARAVELHDGHWTGRHQLGHGGGADEIVHDIEAVVVREEVHPEAKPARGEEHLLARSFAAQEHRIVLGDRLGQEV